MKFFSFGSYMPEIETERLLLRRINMGDAHDLYEYGSDEQVARHVLWSAYHSVAEARSYVRYMIRRYRATEAASWGIIHKESGKLIGTIGYMWIHDEYASAEVGYSLSRLFWNQGYMTESLRAVLDYSFRVLHLNRVEAMHETKNPASGAVMRKCGMVREGLLRQKLMNKGHYVDVELYAILRSDYRKNGGFEL